LIYPLPFLAMPATPNRGRHFFSLQKFCFRVDFFERPTVYSPAVTLLCSGQCGFSHHPRLEKQEDGLKAQLLPDQLAAA